MDRGRARPIAISVRGVNWRRFMFGYRSVPPATSITVIPGVPDLAASCSAARCSRSRSAASSTVAGMCSWKRGSLSILLLLAGVGRRGQPSQRGLRVAAAIQAGRPDAVLLLRQRVEDLLRRDRRLVEPHADAVEHRVADRREHRVARRLAGLLAAVGALRVDGLDED